MLGAKRSSGPMSRMRPPLPPLEKRILGKLFPFGGGSSKAKTPPRPKVPKWFPTVSGYHWIPYPWPSAHPKWRLAPVGKGGAKGKKLIGRAQSDDILVKAKAAKKAAKASATGAPLDVSYQPYGPSPLPPELQPQAPAQPPGYGGYGPDYGGMPPEQGGYYGGDGGGGGMPYGPGDPYSGGGGGYDMPEEAFPEDYGYEPPPAVDRTIAQPWNPGGIPYMDMDIFPDQPLPVPMRSVYGSQTTPLDYGTMIPWGSQLQPWESDSEASAFPMNDEGEYSEIVSPYEEITDDPYGGGTGWGAELSGLHALEGITDMISTAGDYWQQKLKDGVAKLKQIAADVLTVPGILAGDSAKIESALTAARSGGGTSQDVANLEDLKGQVQQQQSIYYTIVDKIRQAFDKVREITGLSDAPQGLGFIPLIAVGVIAAAIAVVVAAAAAAYMYKKHVDELHSEIDLAAKKVLTPQQIASITGSNTPGGGLNPFAGFGAAMGALPIILGIGVVVWFAMKGKRS
jgi:hypothetical protein